MHEKEKRSLKLLGNRLSHIFSPEQARKAEHDPAAPRVTQRVRSMLLDPVPDQPPPAQAHKSALQAPRAPRVDKPPEKPSQPRTLRRKPPPPLEEPEAASTHNLVVSLLNTYQASSVDFKDDYDNIIDHIDREISNLVEDDFDFSTDKSQFYDASESSSLDSPLVISPGEAERPLVVKNNTSKSWQPNDELEKWEPLVESSPLKAEAQTTHVSLDPYHSEPERLNAFDSPASTRTAPFAHLAEPFLVPQLLPKRSESSQLQLDQTHKTQSPVSSKFNSDRTSTSSGDRSLGPAALDEFPFFPKAARSPLQSNNPFLTDELNSPTQSWTSRPNSYRLSVDSRRTAASFETQPIIGETDSAQLRVPPTLTLLKSPLKLSLTLTEAPARTSSLSLNFSHTKSLSVGSIYSGNRNVTLATIKRSFSFKAGEGQRSAYVQTIRRNAGTAYNETGPDKWRLPIGILPVDKDNPYLLSNGRYNRRGKGTTSSGVGLKHGHLQPRLLAAEVDEVPDTNKFGALGRSATFQYRNITPTTLKSSTPSNRILRQESIGETSTPSSSTVNDAQSAQTKDLSRRASVVSSDESVGSLLEERFQDGYYQQQYRYLPAEQHTEDEEEHHTLRVINPDSSSEDMY